MSAPKKTGRPKGHTPGCCCVDCLVFDGAPGSSPKKTGNNKPAGWFEGEVSPKLAKVYVDLKRRGLLKDDGRVTQLWACSCGGVNIEADSVCYRCELRRNLDPIEQTAQAVYEALRDARLLSAFCSRVPAKAEVLALAAISRVLRRRQDKS